MKKIILILLSISLIACEPGSARREEYNSKAGVILKGNHTLIPLKTAVDSAGMPTVYITNSNGGVINFCWMMNDGTRSINQLAANKVRYKVDELCEVPTIKFKWRPSNDEDLGEIFKSHDLVDDIIEYSIITCKEEQLPKYNLK